MESSTRAKIRLRNGHQHVDRPAQHLVDPSAQGRRPEQPQRAADQEGEDGHGREGRHAHRVARAEDEAREHIAAELIGDEQKLVATWLIGIAHQRRLAISRDQRREDSGEDVDRDDDARPIHAGDRRHASIPDLGPTVQERRAMQRRRRLGGRPQGHDLFRQAALGVGQAFITGAGCSRLITIGDDVRQEIEQDIGGGEDQGATLHHRQVATRTASNRP